MSIFLITNLVNEQNCVLFVDSFNMENIIVTLFPIGRGQHPPNDIQTITSK
jgi:hypothetical protein